MAGTLWWASVNPQICTHSPHQTRYLAPFSAPPFTMGIHFVRIWKVSTGKRLSVQPQHIPAAICSQHFPAPAAPGMLDASRRIQQALSHST